MSAPIITTDLCINCREEFSGEGIYCSVCKHFDHESFNTIPYEFAKEMVSQEWFVTVWSEYIRSLDYGYKFKWPKMVLK